MSEFWLNIDKFVTEEVPAVALDAHHFLQLLADFEDCIIPQVTIMTGDREFPHDMRERIMGIIATRRLHSPGPERTFWNEVVKQQVAESKRSPLLDGLRQAFDELAARKHVTRFGVLTNDPVVDVRNRDEFDGAPIKIDDEPSSKPVSAKEDHRRTVRAMRPKSRPQRWADAVSRAQEALSGVQEAKSALEEAMQDLRDVQLEYEEWKDNLPENMQSGATAEKLEAVCDIDLDDACSELDSTLSEMEEKINEAEGADLPLGFGRD